MTLATKLYTWLRGAAVGSDQFGNRYYRDSKGARRFDGRREKRWVVYNGEVEASRVPPEWHGWLHHTYQEPPTVAPLPVRAWQKPHVPNQTGTVEAYRPPGSILYERPVARADYEAWTPE